jgi:Zn ribbon nucleic-acid-binding protein
MDNAIFHPAKDHSPVYVSKRSPSTIENLYSVLNNDDRYAMSETGGRKIRERFVCKVFCADCNNICYMGHLSLWLDKPHEVVCLKCGFVYYPHDNVQ